MTTRRRLLAAGIGLSLTRRTLARDALAAARAGMVAEVGRDLRSIGSSSARREPDARVLAALGKVPSHRFVPERWVDRPTMTGRCRSATTRPSRSRPLSR